MPLFSDGPDDLFEGDIFFSADFDFKNYSYANYTELWVKRPDVEIALKSLLMIIIIILALLGNISIIAVVIRVKGMRTCTNLFIFNMAVADLMTVISCAWSIVVIDAYQNFMLGKMYCKLYGFMHVTCMLSSVFSLVVISGDRLLGIVFPFSRRLSQKQALVIMAAIWVAAMIFGSPIAFWRTLLDREWNDHKEVWCNEHINLLKYYWLIILILLVYMPLIVMAVAYTVIIFQLDKYEHQLFLREHPLKMKYRKKVIKVLFMYVLNFLLFWVLFQVVVLYRYFKPPEEELQKWHLHVFFVGHVLTYAQSAINPIIYGACNESFRKAFRITFRCLFRKNRVHPSPLNNIYAARPRQAVRPMRVDEGEELQNGKEPQSTQETELKPITGSDRSPHNPAMPPRGVVFINHGGT